MQMPPEQIILMISIAYVVFILLINVMIYDIERTTYYKGEAELLKSYKSFKENRLKNMTPLGKYIIWSFVFAPFYYALMPGYFIVYGSVKFIKVARKPFYKGEIDDT